MSKTTKDQLTKENAQLKAQLASQGLEIERLKAMQVERTYDLWFARPSSTQPKNVMANMSVGLFKNGVAGITGVVGSVELNNQGKPEFKFISSPGGYEFFGCKDEAAMQKLANHVMFLVDKDQVPDHYPVRFHGKVRPKVAAPEAAAPKKAGSKVQLALS